MGPALSSSRQLIIRSLKNRSDEPALFQADPFSGPYGIGRAVLPLHEKRQEGRRSHWRVLARMDERTRLTVYPE